ncbi:hypothetical protein Q669_05470 [Labrenzia sp. C1B10]|uniref:hypothetical protein n=1 Tax=unclassified Labrenzia TaxID=2648686 RepID=UPI0003B88DEA|nr:MULTISPECIES: hypothetical protein [unclassified Labrenzia]ERP94326.1 hypothetical protein Q669_05470 [Labrenzia sp. C1B10]ERS04846.1 hypothetical protein Q675_00440 [Labrenzia sp. C1B70]
MKTKIGELFLILGVLSSLVGVPSFFLFLICSILLGGDALNGHVIGDQHFVCAHGECKEVWPFFFNISWYLGVAMISTLTPAVFLGATSQWLLKEERSSQQEGQTKN